jgi:hypothetical protein
VEGLEEDVQQVGTGWAPLCQAVGSPPHVAVDLPITEPAQELGVEGLEAVDDRRWNPGVSQRPEERPPWEAVKALDDVEAGQPKLSAPAPLQDNEVGQQLREVQGTRPSPKPHRRLAQEVPL